MRLLVNLVCRDIVAQAVFYGRVLDAAEAESKRSPIYRALAVGTAELGFNAPAARALLGLAERHRTPVDGADAPPPVTAYPTFELGSPEAVEAAVARVEAAGGRLVKPCFATYYGQWQAVAEDPEQNVFRLAAASLPSGVERPRLDDALSPA